MSLNSALNIASSGLITAQNQLRVVSDNVANVSTPNYVRKIAGQQSFVSATGAGAGVNISQLRLAADRFLQAAGLRAASASAGAQAAAGSLEQAQALFGDPNGSSSYLGGLDQVFAGFTSLAFDSGAAARLGPVSTLQGFLAQTREVGGGLLQLGRDADAQLLDKVAQTNGLLSQIDKLNADISRASTAGGDATGSQNRQSTLIDQLSALVQVRVSPSDLGGVSLRAADGSLLVAPGDKPAVFSYDAQGPTGVLSLSTNGAPASPVGSAFTTGELAALVKTRNVDLPGLGDQLAALAGGVVDALNAAHNAYSAAPAPSSLTGRATALSQSEAFGGFTDGRTAVAVTDASGAVTQRVDVDWAARTLSVNGGAATTFTPGSFVSSLNTALTPAGGASWSSTGALTLTAASGGISVADDPSAPTLRAGKSFSGFLGLNDLVTASTNTSYATGLTASDASGFTGDLTLRLSDAGGAYLTDVKVTAPPAPATLGDLVTALNSPATGVGLYGAFALDADGRLAFTPRDGTGDQVSVVSDRTARGAGGPSVSTLFGVGEAVRIHTIDSRAVRRDIVADPTRLALAGFDWSAGVGARALSSADNRGADALGQAGKALLTFPVAGGLPGGGLSASDYAARVGGDVARRASEAASTSESAQATATEAADRRSSVEGVNLDQELVNLTTYQQAYNASARLVTTVRDMFDALINMV